MYKCSECEKEYNIKPDYCDCGNDVFIEIIEKPQTFHKEKTPKKTFEEQYPGFSNFKKSLDPISVFIFLICIILSILSLIFIGRGDNIAEETEEKTIISKKINTDIESFWDNSLPKIKEPEIIKEEPIKKIEVKEIPKPQPSKKTTIQNKPVTPQVQKPKQQTQKQTVNKQTTSKAQTTPKTTAQTTQKTQTTQTTTQTPKIQTQKIEVSTPKTTTEASKINIQQTPQTVTKKPTQEELQELKSYKNALRNRIFSYIDFASIIGDGVCVITFTINESGKLTNRKFTQKSASTMLNDAVYNAMLKVPSFKQPPSAYKGETLKFTVQFVSGQYEVSLN